jgi:hypothetical protein
MTQDKIDQVIYAIKRYTHDRSKSGYDDAKGACGNPCYQCDKDRRMIQEVRSLLESETKIRSKLVGVMG